jgi:hypothetical protein
MDLIFIPKFFSASLFLNLDDVAGKEIFPVAHLHLRYSEGLY